MTARTLLSLRTELGQRLGFSSSGSGAILQADLLNSALRSGQEQLFYEFGDLLTHRVNDTEPGATVAGQSLYDFPPDLDPLKALTISVQRTSGGTFYEFFNTINEYIIICCSTRKVVRKLTGSTREL